MYKSFPDGNGGFVIYQIDDAGNQIGGQIGDVHDSKLAADVVVKDMITDSGLLLVDDQGSYGPCVLAVAATNEPFIGLKDHPSEIVQINDTDYVRVPMLMQGYYLHPWYGPLIYNQPAVDRIIRNHVMGIAEAPVYYRVNHRENPAVAFFDIDKGGWFAEEVVNNDKLLVGYGVIVEQQRALETIRDYVCASVDIDPDYIPFRIQKFSRSKRAVHVYSINSSWNYSRTKIKQEANRMKHKVTIAGVTIELDVTETGYVLDEAALEALQGITIPEAPEDLQPQLDQATQDLTAARNQVQALEAKVKELGGSNEPDVPEPVRQRIEALERRAQDAERREYETAIRQVVALARSDRDDKGNAHSQVFINWLDSFLNGKAIGQGTDVVKLTSTDVVGYRRYILEAATWLSNHMPKVVPTQSQVPPDPDANPMNGGDNGEEAELAALAAKSVERYTKKSGFKGKDLNGKDGGK